MSNKSIKILCTLGLSTLNKKFLNTEQISYLKIFYKDYLVVFDYEN